MAQDGAISQTAWTNRAPPVPAWARRESCPSESPDELGLSSLKAAARSDTVPIP
jgi:hypothetical protein